MNYDLVENFLERCVGDMGSPCNKRYRSLGWQSKVNCPKPRENSERVKQMRIHTSIKAKWIDSVTELGEEVSAREIADRINRGPANEFKDFVFVARGIGGIIPQHLNHKFQRIRVRSGEASMWKKILP